MGYFETKKKIVATDDTVNLSIDLQVLDIILQYTMSANGNITKKSMVNLRKLIDLLNLDFYTEDYQRILRIHLIKRILEAHLDQKVNNDIMIEDYCMKSLPNYANDVAEIFQGTLFNTSLNNDEVLYVNNFVEQNLTYIYLYKHSESLQTALQKLNGSTSNNLKLVNTEFETVVDSLYRDIKSAKATSEYSAMDFSLGSESLGNILGGTIKELNKPNNFIKTGIKSLNEMLGGGLQNGRTYLFFGLPKGFKSGTLLNLGIWGAKYNLEVETKDKTKQPCVLYVTQENSIKETAERIFVYSSGGQNIKDFTEEEATAIIKKDILGDSPVDLKIIYRPNKTISTTDLNTMCDDLELDGLEVVMLIQDYTKRIRSANYNPDIRLELGNVVDDFTVIAKTRNIPVISAGQLNREAYRVLETALQKGRNNIGKDLNSSHVGESALMVENTDYGIIINKEETENDNDFLTFKLIASRSKSNDKSYFAHPFEPNNGLRLQEDLLLSKSLSIERIGDNLSEFNPNKARAKATGGLFDDSTQAPSPFKKTSSGRVKSTLAPEVDGLNMNNKMNLSGGLTGLEEL